MNVEKILLAVIFGAVCALICYPIPIVFENIFWGLPPIIWAIGGFLCGSIAVALLIKSILLIKWGVIHEFMSKANRSGNFLCGVINIERGGGEVGCGMS